MWFLKKTVVKPHELVFKIKYASYASTVDGIRTYIYKKIHLIRDMLIDKLFWFEICIDKDTEPVLRFSPN